MGRKAGRRDVRPGIHRADRVHVPAFRDQALHGVFDDLQQRHELAGRPGQVVGGQQPQRDDLDPGVDVLCDDILAGAPITVRNSKRMINRLLEMDAAGAIMDDASQAELDALSAEAHGSEDVREGLTAFFERRKPDFKGR